MRLIPTEWRDELYMADGTNVKQMSEIKVYFYLWGFAVVNMSMAQMGLKWKLIRQWNTHQNIGFLKEYL